MSLTDDKSSLWYGEITAGSQTFSIDFDTGSSDLLPGPHCDSTCKIYTADHADDTGNSFSIAYGDGTTAEGEIYTDSVTVAGLTAYGQALGAATNYSSGFAVGQFP